MVSEGKKKSSRQERRFFFLFFGKVFLMGLPSPITPSTSNLHLHSGNIPHCPLPALEDQSTWVSFFPGSVIPQSFTPLGDTNWHQHVHVAHAVETERSSGHVDHSDALWVDVNEALSSVDLLTSPARLNHWVGFTFKFCHAANGYTVVPRSIRALYSHLKVFDFYFSLLRHFGSNNLWSSDVKGIFTGCKKSGWVHKSIGSGSKNPFQFLDSVIDFEW